MKTLAAIALLLAAPAFAHDDGSIEIVGDSTGYTTALYTYHSDLGMCDVFYGRIGEDELETMMFQHMTAFFGRNASVNIARNVGRMLDTAMMADVDTDQLSGWLNVRCSEILTSLSLHRAKWEMAQMAATDNG